jgi:hypothetical protein
LLYTQVEGVDALPRPAVSLRIEPRGSQLVTDPEKCDDCVLDPRLIYDTSPLRISRVHAAQAVCLKFQLDCEVVGTSKA